MPRFATPSCVKKSISCMLRVDSSNNNDRRKIFSSYEIMKFEHGWFRSAYCICSVEEHEDHTYKMDATFLLHPQSMLGLYITMLGA